MPNKPAISVSAETHQRLKAAAEERNTSMQLLMERMINRFLDDPDPVTNDARDFVKPDTLEGMIDLLQGLRKLASTGPLAVCSTEYASMDDLLNVVTKFTEKGSLNYHWLWDTKSGPDEALMVLATGNGVLSEANAYYLCALIECAPDLIRAAQLNLLLRSDGDF